MFRIKLEELKMIAPDDLPHLIAKEGRLQWWNNTINIVNVALVALTFFVTLMSNRLGVWLSAATETRTTREKQISDEKIADSYRQAQIAKATAEESKVEQQKLAIESREGQKSLIEAQEKLADAQRKQAEAELALRQKVDEVKKKQAPRRLTDEQKESMLAILKSGKGGPIHYLHITGDDETNQFSAQIFDVISKSGWKIFLTYVGSYSSSGSNNGIKITVRNLRDMPAHAQLLIDAFKKAGLKVNIHGSPSIGGGIDSEVPADLVEIVVGYKSQQ